MIIKEYLEKIDIVEQERLLHGLVWPIWYQRFVKAYCAIEDGKNAAKWARRAAMLATVADYKMNL